jgi:hypothetical protein
MSLAAVGLVKVAEDEAVVTYSAWTTDLSSDFSDAEIGRIEILKQQGRLVFHPCGPLEGVNVLDPDHFLNARFLVDDEFREAVTEGTRAGAWVWKVYRMAQRALEQGIYPDTIP